MAYPYFTGYPAGGYPQYPQLVQQPQTMQYQQNASAPMPVQQPQPTPQMPQIQNGGLIPVKSIAEVNAWQIAPGNSLTFFVEGNANNPAFIAVKTKGFSQLESPTTELFDLVKRENKQELSATAQNDDISNVSARDIDLSNYATIADFDALRAKYEGITHNVDKLAEIVEKMQFDIDAISDKKSTKKMVQSARKDADAE